MLERRHTPVVWSGPTFERAERPGDTDVRLLSERANEAWCRLESLMESVLDAIETSSSERSVRTVHAFQNALVRQLRSEVFDRSRPRADVSCASLLDALLLVRTTRLLVVATLANDPEATVLGDRVAELTRRHLRRGAHLGLSERREPVRVGMPVGWELGRDE